MNQDLNGKTLKLHNKVWGDHRGIAFAIEQNAHLTIEDSVGGGIVEGNHSTFYLTEQVGPSKLTILGGTYKATNEESYIMGP